MDSTRLSGISFVALDLEATGVAWGHDRIIEIGAVRFQLRDGHCVAGPRFQALVNPGLPIPEVVVRLTGLDDAAVQGAPALAEIWSDFAAFVEGTVVLAHGARADLTWLATEALRLSRQPLAARFFCTLDLARALVPQAPRFTLSALSAHLGLTSTAATFHRALADALHTRNLFVHLAAVSGEAVQQTLRTGALSWPKPERFHLEIPNRLQVLTPLIANHTPCEIVYHGGSAGLQPRPITPLGFFAHQGVPYLRAWCHLADVAKSFRCDRITALKLPPPPSRMDEVLAPNPRAC